ncbi:MAG: hypothetical protein AB4426_34080 [Xenococcaceae cyanobacterium]
MDRLTKPLNIVIADERTGKYLDKRTLIGRCVWADRTRMTRMTRIITDFARQHLARM